MKTEPERNSTSRIPTDDPVRQQHDLDQPEVDETVIGEDLQEDSKYFKKLMEDSSRDLSAESNVDEAIVLTAPLTSPAPDNAKPTQTFTLPLGKQTPLNSSELPTTVSEAGSAQTEAPVLTGLSLQNQPAQSSGSDHQSSGQEQQFSGQEQAAELLAPATLGDEILQGVTPKGLSQQAVVEGPASNRLQQYVDQVAEQILVKTSSSSTDQQVRLVIKQSLLPQTEVLLSRDGAALVVQFVTRSEESSSLLVAHQRFIQEQLSENLSRPVSVDVSTDQQEGRSRGQRDLFAELAEEEQ